MNIQAADHLLTTTRGVRKRLDVNRPVEPEVLRRCIEIALQSPVGHLEMKRHFVIIADKDKRKKVADLYRKACLPYLKDRKEKARGLGEEARERGLVSRNLEYALYQAEHLEEAPVLIILCLEGRVEGKGAMELASFYGSILPAAWSLMLALRARGLGSCWTTLHLVYEKETARLLGIPESVTQAVLLPVAYFTGKDFRPAGRLPTPEQVHWDGWGNFR